MRPLPLAERAGPRACGSRGQSLLETLVALGIASLVLGAACGALLAVSHAKRLDETSASAAALAANAATELRAASEYDAQALAAFVPATWTVLPPSPPPGAPPLDASPVTLSLRFDAPGARARVAALAFSSPGASGSTSFVLQQYAPPPGAQVPAATPSAAP